jgi:hypothetical protein
VTKNPQGEYTNEKSILMLMIAGLFAAMPAFAAEQGHHDMDAKECIQHCAMQSESIDKKLNGCKTRLRWAKRPIVPRSWGNWKPS